MKPLGKMAIWLTVLCFLFLFSSFPRVHAQETVVLHFFYTSTCPHCQEEDRYLQTLESEYANLSIVRYELTDSDSYQLFLDVISVFSEAPFGNEILNSSPLTVIGGYAFSGYDESREEDLLWLIERNGSGTHTDVIQKILDGLPVTSEDFETLDNPYVTLPLIGRIRKSEVSLGIAAIVLGFVDGFNPCAMWILVLLITLLANQKDRKRMWLLGSAFLITSALVYFLIMMSWLQIVLPVSGVPLIRILIGIAAVGFGAFNVTRFARMVQTPEVGCDVTDVSKRRKITEKIRKILAENRWWIALGGIILLAVSVNILELACSAGLPALFTSLLAFRNVSSAAGFGYLSLYILFFLLDDLIVFGVAMITLKVTGITNKYTKFSHLAGGIIMIALGILLIFFPEIILLSF